MRFEYTSHVGASIEHASAFGNQSPRDHVYATKRKSMEDTAASVLLSLDCKSQPIKRHRLHTSSAMTMMQDTRDFTLPNPPPLPHIVTRRESQEEREGLENAREDSASSNTANNVRTGPAHGDEFQDVSRKADSNKEFESAMALASMAQLSRSASRIVNHHDPYQIRTAGGYFPSPHERHPRGFHHYNDMIETPIHQVTLLPPPHRTHYFPAHPFRMSSHPNAHPNVQHQLHHQQEQQQQQQQWMCDYCGRGSFLSFDDACHHEKSCSHNPQNAVNKSATVPHNYYLSARSASMTSVSSGASKTVLGSDLSSDCSPTDQDESKFFIGVTALAVPAADPEWLSEMNCYIRQHCIQAFSAEQDDVLKSSKRGRISLKQVGIRCAFCVEEDIEERAMSAVSYPVSSSGIYESVKRWLKIHLPLCKCIPADVKEKINELEKGNFVPTTRQYWIDSARALGIEDTCGGLRFTHDVNDEHNAEKASEALLQSRHQTKSISSLNKDEDVAEFVPTGKYIVFPEDETIITPFLYALLRQVEPCQFTDADRYIARSRCPKGFNGFQCRHCSGHAGLGKYFPTSPKALSTNSTSQNIFSHVLKCRKCPDEVKDKLKALKSDKGHWTRRTTGWRQKFFEDIWKRLHGDKGYTNELDE